MEDLDALVLKFKNAPLINRVLKRLKEELPEGLLYHNQAHTEDVLRETLFFALDDKLPEKDLTLLALAAAFHDSGFVVSRENHERIGAEFATKAMREDSNFEEFDILAVETMIEDTMLTKYGIAAEHCPTSRLSGYLLDADTSNLGREDFFEKAELVRNEYGVKDKKAFYENLLGLMRGHRWHTEAAKRHRQAKKEENIRKLEHLIQSL